MILMMIAATTQLEAYRDDLKDILRGILLFKGTVLRTEALHFKYCYTSD